MAAIYSPSGPRPNDDLSALSDERLLDGLAQIAASRNRVDARLLAHIAEVDRRQLYLGRGYSSMHAYCTRVLHLSEGAAFKRIAAARAARRFPGVYQSLARGELHLSGIVVLAPHLTADNVTELLRRATHQSKRAIEQLVAEVAPQPDVAPAVQRLVAMAIPGVTNCPRGQLGPQGLCHAPFATPPAGPPDLTGGSTAAPADETEHGYLRPLAPDRFVIRFTTDGTTHDRLRRVQALLRHQVPDGDLASIFERSLIALEQALMKGKFATTPKPRSSPPPREPTQGKRRPRTRSSPANQPHAHYAASADAHPTSRPGAGDAIVPAGASP